MSSLQRLALRAAGERAGVSARTIASWRAEGMAVEVRGGVLTVRVDHLLAWKRWKALTNPALVRRRRSAEACGERDAAVSDAALAAAREAWVAAGGGREAESERAV